MAKKIQLAKQRTRLRMIAVPEDTLLRFKAACANKRARMGEMATVLLERYAAQNGVTT